MANRILYIEDYPVVQEMYREALKGAGFDVDVVSDGKQALALIAKNSYRLILLDILLPNLDGVEFLRQLRSKNPTTEVVVLSDFNSKHNIKDVTELGVKHFLVKVENPPHVLIKKLEEILQDQIPTK